jgi:hypothetical protein
MAIHKPDGGTSVALIKNSDPVEPLSIENICFSNSLQSSLPLGFYKETFAYDDLSSLRLHHPPHRISVSFYELLSGAQYRMSC